MMGCNAFKFKTAVGPKEELEQHEGAVGGGRNRLVSEKEGD